MVIENGTVTAHAALRSRDHYFNERWKGYRFCARFSPNGEIGGADDTEGGDAPSMSGSNVPLLGM